MSQPRLLYLGFALPPGLQALYPELNPAGHAFEVQMATELEKVFDFRSVGLLPMPVPPLPPGAEPRSGMAHELILEDRSPRVVHRFRSLLRLRRRYRDWAAVGWRPDALLVYNLSPVYNAFIRRLRRDPVRPARVLLLLDSSQLGRPVPWLKRLRHRLKPLVIPDAEMIGDFDGCIGLSPAVAKYFEPRGVPFLWMPGACSPSRSALASEGSEPNRLASGPIRFGYFGALAEHAGILEFTRVFLAGCLPATFHVCGYGKLAGELAAMARGEPRLRFHGLLPTPDDCLRFGQSCDVLVNPRPATHGNQNNFASKVFEYALCGRAILSSRMPGVETVLGPAAFYFDPDGTEKSLRPVLDQTARMPRAELCQRGREIHDRVTAHYSWAVQGERMSRFLLERVGRP